MVNENVLDFFGLVGAGLAWTSAVVMVMFCRAPESADGSVKMIVLDSFDLVVVF